MIPARAFLRFSGSGVAGGGHGVQLAGGIRHCSGGAGVGIVWARCLGAFGRGGVCVYLHGARRLRELWGICGGLAWYFGRVCNPLGADCGACRCLARSMPPILDDSRRRGCSDYSPPLCVSMARLRGQPTCDRATKNRPCGAASAAVMVFI